MAARLQRIAYGARGVAARRPCHRCHSGGGRLNFNPTPDDERAGSSASITLGRLNLNEPRSGPALGATPQADLDRELAQLRDSVDRVRLVPQVSLGMRVKF